MEYVGIDLHKKESQLCLLTETGEVMERRSPTARQRFAAVLGGRPLTWAPNHTHTVDVQLPSLYGAPGGPMRALRAALEYRERSCAAVWFSGGRALGEIVGPLLAGIAARTKRVRIGPLGTRWKRDFVSTSSK